MLRPQLNLKDILSMLNYNELNFNYVIIVGKDKNVLHFKQFFFYTGFKYNQIFNKSIYSSKFNHLHSGITTIDNSYIIHVDVIWAAGGRGSLRRNQLCLSAIAGNSGSSQPLSAFDKSLDSGGPRALPFRDILPLRMVEPSVSSSPGNNGKPVNSSTRMQPKLHISIGSPYFAPRITSASRHTSSEWLNFRTN
ncbi:hypothetical protein AGLY_009343 [Aphis glycines]|uniref:Uncharacterized protein n=1 Tax=Aphis glycines TaxID=307491 RepID=A0A6G0TI70_APHGL|nr:hypothetical protein AGLY_009343 [Aphis glycines]